MEDVGLILKRGVSLKNGDPEFDKYRDLIYHCFDFSGVLNDFMDKNQGSKVFAFDSIKFKKHGITVSYPVFLCFKKKIFLGYEQFIDSIQLDLQEKFEQCLFKEVIRKEPLLTVKTYFVKLYSQNYTYQEDSVNKFELYFKLYEKFLKDNYDYDRTFLGLRHEKKYINGVINESKI